MRKKISFWLGPVGVGVIIGAIIGGIYVALLWKAGVLP